MAHYCYQCGAPLQSQWVEERMRETCRNCSWIYYEHRKVSAAVRIDKEGQLLLVQRGIEPWKNTWYIPAGYLEVDEDPRDCAKREVLEETGFEVSVGDLLDVYSYEDDPRGNGIVLLYQGKITGGEIRPNQEMLQVKFFSPEELDGLVFSGAGAHRQIEDWVKEVTKTNGVML